MGNLLNLITPLHKKTNRDYIKRMMEDKIDCMKIARKYGEDYWDGDRKFGYGGYKYDGRWGIVAEKLINHYGLKEDAKILDVGCGKGFLLYELKQLLPKSEIIGFDISEYAIKNAKQEIKPNLFVHEAQKPLPFNEKEFDLAISITTLHNLYINELDSALQEIERVSKEKYIAVESFKNEKELFNLQCWALTCNSFYTPEEWEWIFDKSSYTGDYEFIYFE